MTQTKEPTAETIGEEIATLDKEIKTMEAELAEEAAAPLRWEEITSSTAEELARKEQRRGILPRLLTAARMKRLELRKMQYELEAEPLEAERAKAHEALERAQAKRFEVEEEIAAARQAWSYPHGRLQSLERRIKDAERELHTLRGEA